VVRLGGGAGLWRGWIASQGLAMTGLVFALINKSFLLLFCKKEGLG
jgi:hypothetical protein